MEKNTIKSREPERKMLYLIIHASHTPQDVPCGSSGLPIDVHYYIRRDGTVEKPVPRHRAGRHCPWFDRNSIGVCYEGGMDKEGNTADTRTTLQRLALLDLVTLYLNVFPGMKVRSVKDMTAGKPGTDPGYNVGHEYGGWIKIPKYSTKKKGGRR